MKSFLQYINEEKRSKEPCSSCDGDYAGMPDDSDFTDEELDKMYIEWCKKNPKEY